LCWRASALCLRTSGRARPAVSARRSGGGLLPGPGGGRPGRLAEGAVDGVRDVSECFNVALGICGLQSPAPSAFRAASVTAWTLACAVSVLHEQRQETIRCSMTAAWIFFDLRTQLLHLGTVCPPAAPRTPRRAGTRHHCPNRCSQLLPPPPIPLLWHEALS
jgi:hypothetical protein